MEKERLRGMLLGGGSSHHVRLTYIGEDERREEREIEGAAFSRFPLVLRFPSRKKGNSPGYH